MMASQPTDTTITRRRLLAGAGATGLAMVAGCTSANQSDQTKLSGDIEISGSSTVFPLAMAVAEDFQKQHPAVNVSVSRTGTGGGFKNHFCPGRSDFNNASRPIQPSEKELCQENGVEYHEMKVATDALTVVVNNDADWVDCLTLDELKQIWKPNPAETWSDVNSSWPDAEIKRFGAAETSGTFDFFTQKVIGEEGAHTNQYQPTEKDNLILQGVQGSKYAIGYFGFSYYYNNPDQVKALGIDAGSGCVKPSIQTAKTGKYPLSRPLLTYANKASLAERHVAEFARFYVKKAASEQLVAEQVGYVPITEQKMQSQLEALNQVIESVSG
ncbi:MAG: PstS family phosphate ABC transporter substrate-binding protein [Halodesulfurarchaeum sp.]